MDEVKLFCSKDCPDTCSFKASIKEDKLLITPDKEPFLKNGFVCKKLKGFYKREIKNNKARSFYTKNTKRIKDEYVIEKLADFLIKNKNKKMLFYRGSGSLGYYMGFWDKLFSNFKNCYFVKGSPCDETGIIAHEEDFGVCMNPPIENLKNVETIILFGKNAYTVSPHLFVYLQNLKKEGKKIIYIDPIESQTAKLADRFIQINPATDGILAYMLLAEKGFVETKNNLADITGISENDFTYLLKNIKDEKTAFIEGFGMQRYSNGKNIVQWINRLAYYTHNKDNLYYSRLSKEGLKPIKLNKKNRINIGDIPDFLNKGVFDIIIAVASNPVVTMPEGQIWEKAMKKAVSVIIDTNYTKTTQYADFFIKVGGMFAQKEIQGSYFFNKTLTRTKLINNMDSDIDIVKTLSKMLDIQLEIPKIQEIISQSDKKERVFENRKIELLYPKRELNKIRLITLSNFDYLNSQTDITDKDSIYISKETAKKTGIKNNTDVIVKNKLGEYIFRCFISDRVKGDNAYAYKNRSVFINRLTKSLTTDAIYGISYYDLFVDIVPLKST